MIKSYKEKVNNIKAIQLTKETLYDVTAILSPLGKIENITFAESDEGRTVSLHFKMGCHHFVINEGSYVDVTDVENVWFYTKQFFEENFEENFEEIRTPNPFIKTDIVDSDRIYYPTYFEKWNEVIVKD